MLLSIFARLAVAGHLCIDVYPIFTGVQQQLEELESYAFECGADITPHSLLVEKQRVIIDELRYGS